jgi:hypothetical protein
VMKDIALPLADLLKAALSNLRKKKINKSL